MYCVHPFVAQEHSVALARLVNFVMHWLVCTLTFLHRCVLCIEHGFAEKEIFKRTDVQVIGISPDPVPKQKQFVESQKLTVRCLEILKRYSPADCCVYSTLS
jgi:hypothetical protein